MIHENPRSCWRTPEEFKAWLATRWTFTLDAAADRHNAICGVFWTRDDNAFQMHTTGDVIFINPPYGGASAGKKGEFLPEQSIASWVQLGHALYEMQNYVIMLLPSDTSTEWFEYAVKHGRVELLTPRIKFNPVDPTMKADGGDTGSVLVIFDGKKGIQHRRWKK